jgi:hypothetical protein
MNSSPSPLQTAPLAIAVERNLLTNQLAVVFPSAAKVQNWDALPISERLADTPFNGEAAHRFTVDLFRSPADFLAGVQTLPQELQAANRQALAVAITTELATIKHGVEDKKLSRKDAIERAEDLIERIGGSDLTKIPLQVAAQDYVLGSSSIEIARFVQDHTEHLTPANANALAAFQQNEHAATLDKLEALRAEFSRIEEPPEWDHLATPEEKRRWNELTDRCEKVLEKAESLTDPIQGPEKTRAALLTAAEDFVKGNIDRKALEAKFAENEAALKTSRVLDRLDALKIEYDNARQVAEPPRPNLSEADLAEQNRILTKTRDIAERFDGPDLTKIPLQVAAQDYVKGALSRTDLENFIEENAKAAAIAPPSQSHGQAEERSIADDR